MPSYYKFDKEFHGEIWMRYAWQIRNIVLQLIYIFDENKSDVDKY